MTFMTRPALLPKALARPAWIFLAIVQVLMAFAPLVEVKGANSTPHVEEAGTADHHSHDEASCAACVARTILSSSELPPAADFRIADVKDVGSAPAPHPPADRGTAGADARAPPQDLA